MQQATVRLNSNINYNNVTTELNHVLQELEAKPEKLCIDCSQIQHCDSSISALFIEILRHAKQADLKIYFQAIPERVESILKLSNLNRFIPLS